MHRFVTVVLEFWCFYLSIIQLIKGVRSVPDFKDFLVSLKYDWKMPDL